MSAGRRREDLGKLQNLTGAQPGTAELHQALWSQHRSGSPGPSWPDLVSGGTPPAAYAAAADPEPV